MDKKKPFGFVPLQGGVMRTTSQARWIWAGSWLLWSMGWLVLVTGVAVGALELTLAAIVLFLLSVAVGCSAGVVARAEALQQPPRPSPTPGRELSHIPDLALLPVDRPLPPGCDDLTADYMAGRLSTLDYLSEIDSKPLNEETKGIPFPNDSEAVSGRSGGLSGDPGLVSRICIGDRTYLSCDPGLHATADTAALADVVARLRVWHSNNSMVDSAARDRYSVVIESNETGGSI